MQNFSIRPAEMVASVWRNRSLVAGLMRREVVGRYQGSLLGVFWSFFTPVLMLIVYTFFFSVVFKARWLGGGDSKAEFALVLFAGLLVFNFFAECVNRAPSLIVSNANYVKKIVFPLELLPVVIMGSAGFHLLISFGVWLIFYFVVFGVPQPSVILFPVVILPLMLLTLGISWFVASLGVYVRDVAQIVSVVVPVLMFLSPVFYPIASLPTEYQWVTHISPVTIAVEQARDVIFWGAELDWGEWTLFLLIAVIVAWFGFIWFQKTRRGFADVL